MKKYVTFFSKHWKINSMLSLSILFSGIVCAQNSALPTPDIYYSFDENNSGYVSKIADQSPNKNDGYWYNWDLGLKTLNAGFKPSGGKNGGGWSMSGYHVCCEEMASASKDFILLAGNAHENDVPEKKDSSVLFHSGFQAFTVAFWFKSDRDYDKTNTPCPGSPLGMHEAEILFSMGSRSGLAIRNYLGFIDVKLGNKVGTTEKNSEIKAAFNDKRGQVKNDWQHIAVVYDGNNKGMFTLYIDGEVGKSGYGDPNPVESGFTKIEYSRSSAEIGAQNAGGLFGDPGDGYWPYSVDNEKYCVKQEDDKKYRTGWPAGGTFDDFYFFKDKALTKEQISNLMGGTSNSIFNNEITKLNVFPNPVKDIIEFSADQLIKSISIFDIDGKLVQKSEVVSQSVDVSGLKKGMYIITAGTYHGKFIIE